MTSDTMLIIVSGLLTFGGTVTTAFLQMWRDKHRLAVDEARHRWDIEDRKVKADEALTALQHQADRVAGKVDENTAISEAAFHEANNANMKLLEVHRRINAQEKPDDKPR